jgi:hypothetical protein
MHTKLHLVNQKERNILEELGICCKIIFRWIMRIEGMDFMCLLVGSNDGLF